METIYGVLSTMSEIGNIKVVVNEQETDWISPNAEASEIVKKQLEFMKNCFEGKKVRVELDDQGEWGNIDSEEVMNEVFGTPHKVTAKVSTLKYRNYFKKLNEVECVVEKKGKFNYVSWTDAWTDLKKIYPDSSFKVKDNAEGTPLFKLGSGGAVYVEVTVNGLSHGVWMPVLDYANNSVKYEFIDSFKVNTAIQRGLAKAIALHGLGLYVYRGEDLPHEQKTSIIEPSSDYE